MTLIRSLCSTNELYKDGSSDAIAGHLSNTSSSTMATDESQSDHFERLSPSLTLLSISNNHFVCGKVRISIKLSIVLLFSYGKVVSSSLAMTRGQCKWKTSAQLYCGIDPQQSIPLRPEMLGSTFR